MPNGDPPTPPRSTTNTGEASADALADIMHLSCEEEQDDDVPDTEAFLKAQSISRIINTLSSLKRAKAVLVGRTATHRRNGGSIEATTWRLPGSPRISVVHGHHVSGPDQSIGIGMHIVLADGSRKSWITSITLPSQIDVAAFAPPKPSFIPRRQLERRLAAAAVDLLTAHLEQALTDSAASRDADAAATEWITAIDADARTAFEEYAAAHDNAVVRHTELPTPWDGGALRILPLGAEASRIELPALRGAKTHLRVDTKNDYVTTECVVSAMRADLARDPVDPLSVIRAMRDIAKRAQGTPDDQKAKQSGD